MQRAARGGIHLKPEIKTLLDKAAQSIQAAELLNREGYANFAASRAYYAMFYVAEALLLSREISFSSHSAVIAAFGQIFAKPQILDPKFHRYLIDAQDMRNLGDYGIGQQILPQSVQEMLVWASEFIETAQFILAGE